MTQPGDAVATYRKKYRWQFSLLIAAAAYLLFWDRADLWWNYEPATVEIESVRVLCAALPRNEVIPLEVDECPVIKEKYQSRADVEVKPRTFAAFVYTSPADGKQYNTSLVRDLDDSGQPIHAGSRITVRLSRKEASVVKTP